MAAYPVLEQTRSSHRKDQGSTEQLTRGDPGQGAVKRGGLRRLDTALYQEEMTGLDFRRWSSRIRDRL